MFDIVTFGSAVIDTFIDTEFNNKTKSFNYPAGAKILAHNMRSEIGGGSTNTAVAFARFGFRTGCICRVGDDSEGNAIRSLFKKEKIKFLGSVSKTKKTGHSVVLDSKEKNRTILAYKGPGNNVVMNDIPKLKTRWVHFTGVVGKSFKTQVQLAKKLVSSGSRVAFNPGYIDSKNDLKELLRLTYVLTTNKEEAVAICKKYGKKGPLLDSLRSLGPRIVVITNKNKQAFAFDGKTKYAIKPHKVKVVERTGAGDAFAAGFVAGFIAGMPIGKCLKLALREGESVLKHFGAKNNLLRMKLK